MKSEHKKNEKMGKLKKVNSQLILNVLLKKFSMHKNFENGVFG